jgi:hypothetical protein
VIGLYFDFLRSEFCVADGWFFGRGGSAVEEPFGRGGAEAGENKQAQRFNWSRWIISPPGQLCVRSRSGEFLIHQRADCVVSKSRPQGEVGAS